MSPCQRLQGRAQLMTGMTDVFRHPRKWLAGIHLNRNEDGFPIENVGHDGGERDDFVD